MSSSSPDDNDWYAILGVSPHATVGEIKAAYEALAKETHLNKNIGQEKEAKKRFALLSMAHSILCDPRRRHNYNTRGTDKELNDDMVAKVEELGMFSKLAFGLFNRMGIHIPTDLSLSVLEEARKVIKKPDDINTLEVNGILTSSGGSQKAEFFMIAVTEEDLSKGIIINCVSLSGDKFKALFFDSLGEVSMMEESQPIDKGTETNFFFLPHPTYRYEKVNPMLDRSKEPPLFNLLNNYHKNTYSILPGRHLFAIYHNNWLSSGSIQLSYKLYEPKSFEETKALLEIEEALFRDKEAIESIKSEYRLLHEKLRVLDRQITTKTEETNTLLTQRKHYYNKIK